MMILYFCEWFAVTRTISWLKCMTRFLNDTGSFGSPPSANINADHRNIFGPDDSGLNELAMAHQVMKANLHTTRAVARMLLMYATVVSVEDEGKERLTCQQLPGRAAQQCRPEGFTWSKRHRDCLVKCSNSWRNYGIKHH